MIKRLAFWVCLPFLLPQAIRVRQKAPRFAAASGPNEGATGEGTALRLIAIGDSIVAGVGAEHLSQALVGQTAEALAGSLNHTIEWTALGKIGAKADTVLSTQVPLLSDETADFIVMSIGVNDVTSLAGVSTWRKNLSALIGALTRRFPKAQIVVVGLPPLRDFPLLPQPLRWLFGLRADTFDKVARQVVTGFPMVVYLPLDFDPKPESFAADGYHPSPTSYAELGRAVAKLMEERFERSLSS